MKNTIKIFTFLIGALIVLTSCQDEYDPIGNNKPLPVLKLESNFIAIPSTAESFQINVKTNVTEIEIDSPASWLTGEFKDNIVRLSATANPDDAIRETIVTVATVTGENEAQVQVRVIQSNEGMNNIHANMLRSDLDNDWTVIIVNGEWAITDNSLYTNSPGNINSVMVYSNERATTIRSDSRKFKYSVDVKSGSTSWAGPVFHAKDNKNYYYVGIQVKSTLDVLVRNVSNGNDVLVARDRPIALSGEQDAFLRCEIVTTTENPDQFTLNIYELKTTGDANLNKDISAISKLAYTRTFTNTNISDGGFAGVWGKVNGGYFRRFVLTTN